MAKRDYRERRETYAAAIAAAAPDQTPTVDRRMPLLLACAGVEMPRIFPDDVLTFCTQCGASIYHRPWALAELGPGARAACLRCAARHEQACGERRCGNEAQAPLDASSPQRRTPVTGGITRRALVEAAHYLGEHRR